MLVFSRLAGEALVIAPPHGAPVVTNEVLEVRAGGVRLGIDAPADWLIRRTELPLRVVAPDDPRDVALDVSDGLALDTAKW